MAFPLSSALTGLFAGGGGRPPSAQDWFAQNPYVPPNGNTGVTGGMGVLPDGSLVPAAPGATAASGVIGQGLEQSPGFQFRLGEGLKALERSAAARGTLLTGGTLKGLQRYAQDYASGEYGQRVNQLQGLAALGLNAAGGAGSAGTAYGQSGGDLLTQAANAQAAGQVGAANAWTGGINNAANQALQMYYLSRMFPGAGTPPIMYGGAGPQMIPPGITPTMTTPIPR
jgi:hypothetical protein